MVILMMTKMDKRIPMMTPTMASSEEPCLFGGRKVGKVTTVLKVDVIRGNVVLIVDGAKLVRNDNIL